MDSINIKIALVKKVILKTFTSGTYIIYHFDSSIIVTP